MPEDIPVSDLIQIAIDRSPWRKEGNEKWFTQEASLREILEAEALGLYSHPKVFHFIKEKFFDKLFEQPDLYGVVIIRGPRRIGKTSTLEYLIREKLAEGCNPKSFFYISLDDDRLLDVLERRRLLKEFLSALIKQNEEVKPLIIVLDEVTFYKGWGRAIKNLIDEGSIGQGVAVVATGSYSMELSSAKSELSGRFGPLGESVGGDFFFPPRRFIEVAETALGSEFQQFISTQFGLPGRRLGFLEYLGGYQTEADRVRYGYDQKVEEFSRKFYESLHWILETYKFSGGYPRAIFEAIKSKRSGALNISEPRYRDDIFNLLVTDCRKFGLEEETLRLILTKITAPAMRMSSNLDAIKPNPTIKQDDFLKYIDYLENSGLFMRVPDVYLPEQINVSGRSVTSSFERPKLVVADPAVFIAIYLCSRNIAPTIEKINAVLDDTMQGHLLEATIISHLRFLPHTQPFENINYVLYRDGAVETELADALVWYVNHNSEFVTIPMEVKYSRDLDEGQIKNQAVALKKAFGVKRLVVVCNSKEASFKFKVTEDYAIISAELFLLLF